MTAKRMPAPAIALTAAAALIAFAAVGAPALAYSASAATDLTATTATAPPPDIAPPALTAPATTPPPAAAQPPQRQPRGEAELPWLFAVYIITWAAFFGYALMMSRRQREMRREIDALKRAVAASDSQPANQSASQPDGKTPPSA